MSTILAADDNKNEQDWFENVENFRPLRGGRRAGTLNEVATGNSKITVEVAEKKFIKEFSHLSSIDDPLESMCNYVIWFEDHFPSGKHKYFYPILYKICTKFSTMDIYKNDERLLRMWQKLAENFPESGLAVMEFAFAKGSCRQLAKFYISWSQMYQSIGWWNKAREKLQLGQKMCAMPVNLLHEASDEVESCVMLLTCSSNDKGFEENLDSLETRETLCKLRSIGRRHIAPILRAPQGPPGILSKTTKESKMDKFEIFSEDCCLSTPLNKNCLAFETPTPIGPKIGKKSQIALSLAEDLNYQALFGAFDEKIDMQLTNEENTLRTSGLTGLKLCDVSEETPIEKPTFTIYRDQQENTRKAKLRMKKELIREMSVEEGYAKKMFPQPQ